jgi:Gpi18-like mannosyltransferase
MKTSLRRLFNWDTLILLFGIAGSMAIRIYLIGFVSGDYRQSTRHWFDVLLNEGYKAFATGFSNYSPAYLYFLYLSILIVVRFPLDRLRIRLTAIKLPSILADYLLAGFGSALVRLRYPTGHAWSLAFVAILFTPTVIVNSAMWGQADVFFTTALLACIYLLLRRHPYWAMLAFGIGFAFKLQAAFLAPLLLILLLKGRIPWKSLLLIPLPYLVSILPPWVIGRSLGELLRIYLVQVSEFSEINLNTPNLYSWLPQDSPAVLYTLGLVFAGAAVGLFVLWVYKSQRDVDDDLIIQLATFTMLLVPFVLPRMHERYFYPADILSVIYAFYFPRYFYLPLLVITASLLAYIPFLYDTALVPLPILSLLVLAALLITGQALYRSLREKQHPVVKNGAIIKS